MFKSLFNNVQDMLNKVCFFFLFGQYLIINNTSFWFPTENKLYAKAEKCEFHIFTVSVLDLYHWTGADPLKSQTVTQCWIPRKNSSISKAWQIFIEDH